MTLVFTVHLQMAQHLDNMLHRPVAAAGLFISGACCMTISISITIRRTLKVIRIKFFVATVTPPS